MHNELLELQKKKLLRVVLRNRPNYPKSGTILLLTIFNNRHSVAVIDSAVLAGGEVDIKGDPVAPLIVLQTRY